MLDKHVIHRTKLYLRKERNNPYEVNVETDKSLVILLAWLTKFQSEVMN